MRAYGATEFDRDHPLRRATAAIEATVDSLIWIDDTEPSSGDQEEDDLDQYGPDLDDPCPRCAEPPPRAAIDRERTCASCGWSWDRSAGPPATGEVAG